MCFLVEVLTLWNVDKVPGDVVDEDVSAPVAGEQNDEAGESELCLLPAHCNCTQVHSTVHIAQCTVQSTAVIANVLWTTVQCRWQCSREQPSKVCSVLQWRIIIPGQHLVLEVCPVE